MVQIVYQKVVDFVGTSIKETSDRLDFPTLVPDDASYKTITLLNPNAVSASVNVIAFDNDGSEIEQVSLQALSPMETRTLSLTNIFSKGTLKDLSTARVESDSNIVGFQLVDYPDGDLAGLPALTTKSNELTFPVFTEGGGLELWTAIRIFNPGDNIASITIEAFDASNNSLGIVDSRSLPPRTIYSLSTESMNGVLNAAFFQVTSDQPASGYEVIGVVNGEGLTAILGISEEQQGAAGLEIVGSNDGSVLNAYTIVRVGNGNIKSVARRLKDGEWRRIVKVESQGGYLKGSATAAAIDVQLQSGVSYNDSVTSNQWKYYYINIPSGATKLEIKITNLTKDVDLYTRYNAKPTLASYVCRPYFVGTTAETCSHTNPAAGTWWAGVYGFAAGSFTITAIYTTGGTYSLSGKITLGGNGRQGITVNITGLAPKVTDPTGNYTFSGLGNGAYTITPSKGGYAFSPTNLAATISGGNVAGKDFVAKIVSNEQPPLKAPWAGKAYFSQGNNSSCTHNVCGLRTGCSNSDNTTCAWENAYALDIQKFENGQAVRFDVLAPADGEIVDYLDQFNTPGNQTGPGKLLYLKVKGPTGRDYTLVFAHLWEIYKKSGSVKQGEVIAKAGVKCSETPEVCGFSTGYHLHFHIWDTDVGTKYSHTMPIGQLWMKRDGESNFKNYETKGDGDDDSAKGSLDDSAVASKYFWSDQQPLTVSAPNGGENWGVGTTQTIRWNYSGNPGSSVKIELLKAGTLNGPVISNTSIGSGGTGSYSWTIPSNQTPGNDYKIRITGTSDSSYTDTSDNNFTITGSGCSGDLGESNDSFGSAYPLSCNADYPAKICSSTDVDYYRVAPSNSGTMTVTLTPPSDRDYDLYVYNSSQTQICSSAAGTGIQDKCSPSVTGGQTYYVRVIGFNAAFSSTSSYGIGISCPGTCTTLSSPNSSSPSCGGTVSTTTPTLSWSDVVNESGYVVRVFSGSSCSGSPIHTSPQQSANTTSYPVPSSAGLQSGQTYSWQMQARGNGTSYCDSAWSGCCSFNISGPPPGPSVTDFKINNGAASTTSRTVTLNNTATGNPTQYIASESSSFSGATWQSYSSAPNFTLSSGNGTKTVYFKVRNSSNAESGVVSDSITLSEIVPPQYEGYHDGADCTSIYGWAWDRNQPNTAINVDIYDGGAFLSTVTANIFRQDLLNAGKGNGYHGFNYATPSGLKDGRQHSISVRFSGTSTSLVNTPRSITCGGPVEIIVDDLSSGFSRYGTPSFWKEAAIGYNGHMFWTYNNQNTIDNYAIWQPNLSSGGAGTYVVYVYIPSNYSDTTNATYTIYHNGVTDTRTINQLSYSNVWVSLGSFYFSANGGEYVKLVDKTGETAVTKRIGFDAVKWVK